jgi:hypothetical protein
MLASIDATNDRSVYTWWADQLKVVSGSARTNSTGIGNHKIVEVQSMQQKKSTKKISKTMSMVY